MCICVCRKIERPRGFLLELQREEEMIEECHVNKKRKHLKCEQAMPLLSPLCLHRLCLSFNPTNKNPVKWGQKTLVASEWHCAADPIRSISETISIRIYIHKTFFFIMMSIIIFYNINFSFWIILIV